MNKFFQLCLIVMLGLFLSSIVFAQQPDDEDYDKYLIKCLKDDNIGVRTSAAQLLGDRKAEAAVKPLLKMLKSEKRYCARIVAALALYKIGDEKAIPALEKVACKDKCKTVRRVTTAIVQEMHKIQLVQKEAQQIGSQ